VLCCQKPSAVNLPAVTANAKETPRHLQLWARRGQHVFQPNGSSAIPVAGDVVIRVPTEN
jgi:hypothetical protein